MKNNKIKLSESDLHRIIKESVKNILSEVDWNVAADASKASNDIYDILEDAWAGFEDASNLLISALNGIDDRGYRVDNSHSLPSYSQGAKLSQELSSLKEKIYSYINRKHKQSNNLNQMSDNKFKDAFNNKTYDEVENDIDNKFNDYLDSNESNWNSYRNKNLSPDEIKFDKRNRGN